MHRGTFEESNVAESRRRSVPSLIVLDLFDIGVALVAGRELGQANNR